MQPEFNRRAVGAGSRGALVLIVLWMCEAGSPACTQSAGPPVAPASPVAPDTAPAEIVRPPAKPVDSGIVKPTPTAPDKLVVSPLDAGQPRVVPK